MKWTNEQKAAKREERERDRAAWAAVFPAALFILKGPEQGLGSLFLSCEEGICNITAHVWVKCSDQPGDRKEWLSRPAESLDSLAGLIKALIARYNYCVREMNETVSEIQVMEIGIEAKKK